MRFERIDQLRGFAALAVVVCHFAGSAFLGAPNAGESVLPWWIPLILGFGYLGVPLFFVISGFCIHLPQARAIAAGRPATPSWKAFFRRRFWRLYPPYLGALAVAAVLLVVGHGTLPVALPAIVAQAFLVQTFHPATFDGLNPPAWTLAVEAQLYLAYPIAFLLIARLGAKRALGVVFAITMGYRALLNFDPMPSGFGGVAWEFFLARWFEWVLGATIAAWAVGEISLPWIVRQPWFAALVLAAGVAFEWQAWRPGAYTFKEPLYGAGFALLVIVALDWGRSASLAAASSEGDVSEAEGPRPISLAARVGKYFAGVGVYSYSVYLLHRPIQLALEPLARKVAELPFVIEHRIPSSFLIMAASTPVVLWVARLFFRWVEGPSIAIAQRVGRSPAVAAEPIERKTAVATRG